MPPDQAKPAPGPPRIEGLKLQGTLGFLVYLFRQRSCKRTEI